jgi:hypothetical protein
MRLVLACVLSFAALLGVLAFSPVAAFAVVPEVPLLEVSYRTTGSLEVRGFLDPKAPGEAGSYEFLYKQSSSECTGGKAKAGGLSFGSEREEVIGKLSELEPGSEYTVCLVAHNLFGETGKSAPLTVKTTVRSEVPEAPRTVEEAGQVSNTQATLEGVVNPRSSIPVRWFFEYAAGSSCKGGHVTTPQPSKEPQELEERGVRREDRVSTRVLGLVPNTKYTFCLLARNEAEETSVLGPADEASFTTTASAPVVGGESALKVASSEATVGATLEGFGSPTSYRVEYGTSEPYASTAETSLGAIEGPTNVQVRLSGLSSATTYHFRFVATTPLGSTTGQPAEFTTPAASGGGGGGASCPNSTFTGFSASLPDCRAYEAVSAGLPSEVYVPGRPQKTVPERTQDIFTKRPMRAAGDGERITFVAEPGESGGDGEVGPGIGNSFLAARTSQGRWQASDIEAPGIEPAFEAFSSDLSVGVRHLLNDPELPRRFPSPEVPPNCNVLYSRTISGEYRSLFTETQTPGFCGTNPAEYASQKLLSAGGNEGTGTVPAFTHLLFQSPAALSTEALLAPESAEGSNLYESIDGAPRIVNLLPGQTKSDPDAVFGGRPAEVGSSPDFSNVISADGSLIFWTALDTGIVYAREHASTTVQVSAGAAQYWTATPDGRFVFYIEGERLWRFDTTAEAGHQREELTGAGVGVRSVIGASSDGSYIYFVATGALAPGSEARKCRISQEEEREKEQKGEPISEEERQRFAEESAQEENGHLPAGRGCNLYLLHEGNASLVAVLAARDNQLKRSSTSSDIGAWQVELGARTAEVTPSGRQLVFESTQQLTGYDNASVGEEGERRGEVFVYDTESGPHGHLSCVSCAPTGAAPVNEVNTGGGSYLPVSLNPTFMRRWINDEGSRVFFDSSQPLVSRDVNGIQDVYEWEREDTPGCPKATSVWGGCVSILSGGESENTSYFIDADATGENVFFTHRGPLGGVGALSGKTEVFDARVDGGVSEASLACTGTGCQGVPPSSPTFATPPSATLGGGGNFAPQPAAKGKTAAQIRAERLSMALKACQRKHDRHKRALCERQAHKRYGPARKAKRSGTHAKQGRRA